MLCAALVSMPLYAYEDSVAVHEPAVDAEEVEKAEGLKVLVSDKKQKEQTEKASVERSEGINSETSANKWINISGRTAFLSDYVYRGQTQTFGGPAVQGELIFSQKKAEGIYVSIFGSNVDNTTASNGSGAEIDFAAGYIYKPKKDLSLKLELLYTKYPGAYAPLLTKDKFDQLELIPTVTYQYLTVLWAYCFTDVRGINQNFAPTFFTPLTPNGRSKGSWYAEASLKLPIPATEDKLNFIISAGYEHIHNYSVLSYGVFGAGLTYELPESFAGLILSVNGSATTARKKYYTAINSSGQPKNLVAPKLWVGVTKEF